MLLVSEHIYLAGIRFTLENFAVFTPFSPRLAWKFRPTLHCMQSAEAGALEVRCFTSYVDPTQRSSEHAGFGFTVQRDQEAPPQPGSRMKEQTGSVCFIDLRSEGVPARGMCAGSSDHRVVRSKNRRLGIAGGFASAQAFRTVSPASNVQAGNMSDR